MVICRIFRSCSWLRSKIVDNLPSKFLSSKTLRLLVLSSKIPKNLDVVLCHAIYELYCSFAESWQNPKMFHGVNTGNSWIALQISQRVKD